MSADHHDLPPTLEHVGQYLAGELPTADAARIAAYLATNTSAAIALDALRHAVDLSNGEHPENATRAWNQLQARLERTDVAPSTARHTTRRSVLSWPLGATAVAVLAIVSFTMLRPRSRPAASDSSVQLVQTANGERKTVTLRDGTRITLNAKSTLRVPTQWSDTRTVDLSGEALFHVAHTKSSPFVVNVAGTRITVLGTAFVVRRYSEDHSVRVAVADGRVMAQRATARKPGPVLSARMIATLTDSGRTIVETDADIIPYTRWTRGELVFDNTPLPEVIPELERRYGIVIHITDSLLAHQRLTATITDDPPSAVLDLMAMTLGVRYVRSGHDVTFFSAPAPTKGRLQTSFRPEASHGK